MIISIGTLVCGLFISLLGYKAMKEKLMKLMPINRKEILTGVAAEKAGKQLLIVGLIISIVGLIFIFSSI